MRCIFIVAQYPISPNFRGGGSATFYERLSSLWALGHEIHLWHYAYPAQRQVFDEFVRNDESTYRHVQRMCASITLTTLPAQPGLVHRLTGRAFDWAHGTRVENPLLRTVALQQLERHIRRVDPDFIWAHHFGPARVATLQLTRPVIYSHHDWLFRVKALASGGAENPVLRKQEEDVARSAAAVVSGSLSECRQLRAIGCRAVAYIPVAYEPAADAPATEGAPRLVHLGGLSTTANRVGLERFFATVWPSLPPAMRDLWVIGDTRGASPALTQHLRSVTCTGHVRDLRDVLRPCDLHIIPWEHDTGQRTRLPLIFNYRQVVVAVRAAVAGFPEVRDGENCRLVDRLDQMASVIAELFHDHAQRRRLAEGARMTFEKSFTRQALLPRYAAIIDAALEGAARPGAPRVRRWVPAFFHP